MEHGEGDRMALTTVQDLAGVVARAVEYDGEWPVMGGIKGSERSVGELIALGEKIRGVFDDARIASRSDPVRFCLLETSQVVSLIRKD